MKTQLAALVAAIALAAPLAANAQDVPSYADQGQQDQQIKGRIVSFDGSYNLQVRDDNGYVDNVQLHDGTVINPTGLTLSPNMVVSILGTNGGNVFQANEVDTPYTYSAGVPYYEGHAWDYYGPTIGLSFFFGGGSTWWHGAGYGYGGFRGYAPYHGGYGYRTGYYNGGGTRVYNNVRVNNDYTNRSINNYHNTPTYHGGTPATGYVHPAGSPRYLQGNVGAQQHNTFQGGGSMRTQFRPSTATAPRAESHPSTPHNEGNGEHRH